MIMAGTRKHNLRTVEVNREDFNKKLKKHRRRVGVLVIFVLALLASAAVVKNCVRYKANAVAG